MSRVFSRQLLRIGFKDKAVQELQQDGFFVFGQALDLSEML